MAQEENVFGCSYSGGGGSGGGRGGGGNSSGGGGCRSKKIKPKKVPQRGLGVAQLEKIISEEQQKESLQAANILAVQKFRPNLSPFQNPVPLSPSSQSNLSSPNALFRHAQSAPNIEVLQESCSVSKHSNSGGATSSPRQSSLPRLWGGDCNHHGSSFDPHGNLVYESNGPDLPQRSHHFQPPPPSMMQSGISPSSVLSSHLEPPSNQSSNYNNYTPQWSEEDKMVGMKRSYLSSLESPPPPSHFRPSSSFTRDDLALCSSGYTQPRNKFIRESPLAGDDRSLAGDFLTLAPPSATSDHNHNPNYECRTSKEFGRSPMNQNESLQQSFNFFPVTFSTDPSSKDVRNGEDEKGDAVDLNLKL